MLGGLLYSEGEQNTLSQNMPFWHKDYFDLIIFEKELFRSSENEIEVKVFKGKLTFIKEVFICKGLLCTMKRKMTRNRKSILSAENVSA